MKKACVVAIDHPTPGDRTGHILWHVWSPFPFNGKGGKSHISDEGFHSKNMAEALADYINAIGDPNTHPFFSK